MKNSKIKLTKDIIDLKNNHGHILQICHLMKLFLQFYYSFCIFIYKQLKAGGILFTLLLAQLIITPATLQPTSQ